MSIGGSIFLIAVGAILRYAVTESLAGIDLNVVGLILMIAGGVGLLIALFFLAQGRGGGVPPNGGPPPPPDDRPPPRY
ncbi:MAG TPA: DUF6458 family protein [Solirubrobacterales bacterium]|nr:DUF6458 family protein [Solirubrobacterales bacterium]